MKDAFTPCMLRTQHTHMYTHSVSLKSILAKLIRGGEHPQEI
jgi:hypothetical protein